MESSHHEQQSLMAVAVSDDLQREKAESETSDGTAIVAVAGDPESQAGWANSDEPLLDGDVPDDIDEELTLGIEHSRAGELNLTIAQEIKTLYIAFKQRQRQYENLKDCKGWEAPLHDPELVQPQDKAAFVDEWKQEEHVYVPRGYNHFTTAEGFVNNSYDLQRIKWEESLSIPQTIARDVRDNRYRNRHMTGAWRQNSINRRHLLGLPETLHRACFVPAAMHTKHRAASPDPEFRNLMVCQDQLTILYANRSKVWSERLYSSSRECVTNLSKTNNGTIYHDPVRITTLNITQDPLRSICAAGGYDGEIAICNLTSESPRKSVKVGFVTQSAGFHPQPITINHIDLDSYADAIRGRPLQAVVSCNDKHIRTLDVTTSTWLSGHSSSPPQKLGFHSGQHTGFATAWPVNCTRSSPDGRLRVVVGDTSDVLIINAATGYNERRLLGHKSYCITADWSPDGRYIATSSHDKMCNIWDTRMWRGVSSWYAAASPYHTLKFSPEGGGPNCLMCAEAADRLTIVNAEGGLFKEQQTQMFWGGVLGADFWPDGQRVVVANSDGKVGGFMEYRRWGGEDVG